MLPVRAIDMPGKSRAICVFSTGFLRALAASDTVLVGQVQDSHPAAIE
jgi:hypothetical protein